MNRTTIAVLVTAALVGTVGGTVTAVVRDRAGAAGPPSSTAGPSGPPSAGPTRTPSASPSRTPSPSPTPTTFPLLYASTGVIHDGSQEIRYDAAANTLVRLVRLREGYLIAYPIDEKGTDPDLRLAAVAPDGTTTKVADVRGSYFDLDARRNRVVGAARTGGRLTIWDLRGRVRAEAPVQGATQLDPVFSGDEVLFSGRVRSDDVSSWVIREWDPARGSVQVREDDARTGMVHMVGSPDDELLAGDVGVDGSAVEENGCTKVVSNPGADFVAWRTCDWRRFASRASFSPDGARLLAISAATAVGGEADYSQATFAVFSATQGPAVGLRRVKAPDGTVGASWRGNDRILFWTYDPGDAVSGPTNDSVLQDCTLDGRCREVARTDDAWLVVGDEY